jgi:hypothetical protein
MRCLSFSGAAIGCPLTKRSCRADHLTITGILAGWDYRSPGWFLPDRALSSKILGVSYRTLETPEQAWDLSLGFLRVLCVLCGEEDKRRLPLRDFGDVQRETRNGSFRPTANDRRPTAAFFIPAGSGRPRTPWRWLRLRRWRRRGRSSAGLPLQVAR